MTAKRIYRAWDCRRCIFVEPGNFAFDYVLLALEVGGFALAVWSLIAIGLNPRGMAGRALD